MLLPLPHETLTRREMEVFKLVSKGLTNREIAEILFLAESTVEGHVKNITEKLGVNNRAKAIVYACSHGLFTPESQDSQEAERSIIVIS